MMKKRWLIWLAVFFLGFGLGNRARSVPETSEEPPAFSLRAEPTEATQATLTQTAVELSPEFPCSLRYTSLVVRGLACYDGPYSEDGSDEEVIGIAALVVENTATVGIEYTQIVLTQDGRELSFDATYIPPCSTILIPESSRAPYSTAEVDSCRCRTVIPGDFDWSKNRVALADEGLCSLAVTNLTGETLSCVRVYYKAHLGREDLYVGGITYSVTVTDLAPGETRTVTPYRYASGYAQVVAVDAK